MGSIHEKKIKVENLVTHSLKAPDYDTHNGNTVHDL